MKKFLIIISLFLVLISSQQIDKKFTLQDYFSGEYFSYSTNETSEKSINLGFCYMQNENVDYDIKIGESVKIYNFEPVCALKTLGAKVVKTEYLENGTVVLYAFTNLIEEEVEVDNKKVNLQIAHNDEYTILGWPLILGSF